MEPENKEIIPETANENSPRNWLLIVAIAAVVAVGVRAIMPGNSDSEAAVSASRVNDVNISATSSRVNISSHAGNDVTVELTGNLRGRDLIVDEDGDELEIRVERRGWIPFNWGRSILEVRVPERFDGDLTVRTSSGGINLDGLAAGDLTVNSSSGGQNHDNLRVNGVFTARSSSGGIRVDNVVADRIELQSSSGGIRSDDLPGNRLTARSSSGSINLQTDTITQDWDIESSSGGVRLEVARPGNLRVDFQGSSGGWNLQNQAFDEPEDTRRNRLEVSTGNGGPLLSVRTSSGGFTLR